MIWILWHQQILTIFIIPKTSDILLSFLCIITVKINIFNVLIFCQSYRIICKPKHVMTDVFVKIKVFLRTCSIFSVNLRQVIMYVR